jgi:hypothetical protein
LYKDNANVLPSPQSQNIPLALSNFSSSHWIKPSRDPQELNARGMAKTCDSEARNKSSSS